MNDATAIPTLPRIPALLLGSLPLAPAQFVARRLVAAVARRHPGLFDRLGAQADKSFLIDATDLPFVFRLEPRRSRPLIFLQRRGDDARFDARIAGPFAALVGMLHGAFDGDALFFSGDIVIEGDTEAVLALRNALDDAEIDLIAELLVGLGPFGGLATVPARAAAAIGERLTGVPLTRGGALR